MYKIVQWFIKITGYIPSLFYFKKKIYYENRKKQGRIIKGGAIVISNHTSIYDFALYMFTFPLNNLRPLTGEALYQKNKVFSWFLNALGAIKVERADYDFSFMSKAKKYIEKGQKILIFPEGRLPKEGEGFLEFKPSFVYMALETKVPIIPVYTNGSYKKKERARVIVGEPLYLYELYDNSKSEKENIDLLSNHARNYIIRLGMKLDEKREEEK